MMYVILVASALLLAVAPLDGPAGELQPPVPILAGGLPLDVEHEGHAAPFVGDFDEDGRKDLLVGEFYTGRLRIYRNRGTNRQPEFAGFDVLHDEAATGCVPTS
jgi:hypothetical protein